ncbi:TRAP-type mannitol/chloroaromatic compound transport system, small permease component [marine gamma proteobacterium HTCC2143]|jgi:TRAP-type mannitol/chloroaromatic compound transport system permease small subunit|uniref:TRAP transporter small permease protein n=1 Tax=marine gamma proteobacterium HTCC2143 TaxID=247633 RepID=A0Y921_9GAMM|nr:TRAP-type mannitol/chloroaromatic compound transport system, small permease component [marine gamma proteobacterium HTCC2143]
MAILALIQNNIDRFSDVTGRILAWLCLLLMLLSCSVVFIRYGLGAGSIALQESVTYLHGTIFMLGAAYTLRHDGHVRVDIFYRNMSARSKAWVNCGGGIIFLLPLCVYFFISSWGFVQQSWEFREISSEPGGIPAVFLLKTLIPLMAVNLGLQAFAETLRNLLILIAREDSVQL